MNPCPCGYYNVPESTKECTCPAGNSRYRNDFKGPLLWSQICMLIFLPLKFDHLLEERVRQSLPHPFEIEFWWHETTTQSISRKKKVRVIPKWELKILRTLWAFWWRKITVSRSNASVSTFWASISPYFESSENNCRFSRWRRDCHCTPCRGASYRPKLADMGHNSELNSLFSSPLQCLSFLSFLCLLLLSIKLFRSRNVVVFVSRFCYLWRFCEFPTYGPYGLSWRTTLNVCGGKPLSKSDDIVGIDGEFFCIRKRGSEVDMSLDLAIKWWIVKLSCSSSRRSSCGRSASYRLREKQMKSDRNYSNKCAPRVPIVVQKIWRR